MAENRITNRQSAEHILPAQLGGGHWHLLQLFIGGVTARSHDAITRVRQLCDRHLSPHYDLEIIDIYQNPQQTRELGIVAVPMLIFRQADSPRRIVGSIAEAERFLADLKTEADLSHKEHGS